MTDSVKDDTFRGIPLSQLFPEEREGWMGYVWLQVSARIKG
jgi:hypothetical protein